MGDTGEYRRLLLKKYMEQEERFDPLKINLYRDCFLTTHYSVYHINKEGRINRVGGEPRWSNIENGWVRLIGGLDHETYRELRHAYGWCVRPGEITKEKVTDLIMKHGKHIRVGRVIAVVLEHDSPGLGMSDWMITSPVKDIGYVQ